MWTARSTSNIRDEFFAIVITNACPEISVAVFAGIATSREYGPRPLRLQLVFSRLTTRSCQDPPPVATMQEYEALTRRLFFSSHNVKRFRTLVVMNRIKVGLRVPIRTP